MFSLISSLPQRSSSRLGTGGRVDMGRHLFQPFLVSFRKKNYPTYLDHSPIIIIIFFTNVLIPLTWQICKKTHKREVLFLQFLQSFGTLKFYVTIFNFSFFMGSIKLVNSLTPDMTIFGRLPCVGPAFAIPRAWQPSANTPDFDHLL